MHLWRMMFKYIEPTTLALLKYFDRVIVLNWTNHIIQNYTTHYVIE